MICYVIYNAHTVVYNGTVSMYDDNEITYDGAGSTFMYCVFEMS